MNVAVLGEVLLRLSPPGAERLFQSSVLRANFGGAEANVAVSLAGWGHAVRVLSVLPANAVGDAALEELRKKGLETSFIRRAGDRLGIYFAETGSGPRPSRVIYDRARSGLAEAGPGDFDWDRTMAGVDWFHVSGITPALSASAAALTEVAIGEARRSGATVSLDLNFRAKLWRYGPAAPEVMDPLVRRADLLFANEEDCQRALGMSGPQASGGEDIDAGAYEDLATRVLEAYPNLSRVAITLRESHGADENVWSAVLRSRAGYWAGPRHRLRAIVDRIGAGDAFAAGLIHGLASLPDERAALAFALAASALKHTVPGDFNIASEAEVVALAAGDSSGRIRR
ncbi:MAG: sugar kinase [Candidatus Aminicenantes bacterium]|nr:sugar kinase [Candidatus Aminicenantes bacterium]